jgi:hypothetical protein
VKKPFTTEDTEAGFPKNGGHRGFVVKNLFSNDFDEHAFLAVAVELTVENLLPWPEI